MKAFADIWPVVLSIVGLIVWAVRLEGRVNQVEKIQTSLEIKHEASDSKVVDQLSDVRESLARIEGHLGINSQKV